MQTVFNPRNFTFLVCALAALGSASSRASDLPSEVKLGEDVLRLNGAGVRTKTFLQLYEAGLYLQQPSRDAAAIAKADEPMVLRIKITSGFVSQANMVESLNEGFRNATKGNTAPIQAEIQQFRDCFSEDIRKGDVFNLVYHPRLGVLVNKNGKSKGVIKGLAFKQALFNIWLSEQPADKTLKQALITGGRVR
jgi:hypothetical protein